MSARSRPGLDCGAEAHEQGHKVFNGRVRVRHARGFSLICSEGGAVGKESRSDDQLSVIARWSQPLADNMMGADSPCPISPSFWAVRQQPGVGPPCP